MSNSPEAPRRAWGFPALVFVLVALVAFTVVTAWLRRGAPTAASRQACLALKSAAKIDEVLVPGGSFDMGKAGRYPEEVVHQGVVVKAFWIDRTEVTNAAFAAFVKATGYVTLAERGPSAEEFPDMPPEQRIAGGAVFFPPASIADQSDMTQWWRFVEGANWRHPLGPNSSIEGRDTDPVVQIAYVDAKAYAKWAGRELPSEAEWEWAARSGSADGAWDDPQAPADPKRSNTWQGTFPVENKGSDGYSGLASVGCFPPDSHGVYDLIGNAWELTSDPYGARPAEAPSASAHVIKGGSYLCAPNYCARYRPAARQAGSDDISTSHIGFRTVRRAPS